VTRLNSRLLFASFALVTLLCLGTQAATPEPKVYRDRVEPHWFAENSRFWYRNDLRDGAREFILVDAEKGTRQLAFDQARVATALSQLTGQTVTADKLPVEALEFRDEGKTVLLRGVTDVWILNLETYELVAEPAGKAELPSLPADRNPRPSKPGGPETEIVFLNKLGQEVELFWIDEEGDRQSYGKLKDGEERRQHTFAGHVWLMVDPVGQTVAVFEAGPERARALVEKGTDQPRPTRERRRGRPSEPVASVPSPDGRWGAFVRDHNLWVRERSSDKPFALSFDGNPGNSFRQDVSRDRLIGMEYTKADPPPTLPEVFWAPDSKKLVALQTRLVPERRVYLVASSPADQLQPKLDSYPYLKAGDDIPVQTPRLFDVAARREVILTQTLFPTPWSLSEFRWASNSSRFTFLYNQRGHQVLRLLGANATNGVIQTIVEEQSQTFIDYSGKFYCEWIEEDELVWMSERDGWNHLYLYDARTGQVKNRLTQGDWPVQRALRLDKDKRQVWFLALGVRPGQDLYHTHLCRVNLDGSGFLILTEGDGTHRVTWSPDHRFFLDVWSRVDLPPITELRRSEDGHLLCRLEEADASEVVAARGRFPERFVAKGRDGQTDIYGIIHRPRDFDPARKYPVIENIYAGPHDFHVPKPFRAGYRHQERLADCGFIVVQIDGMGTSGRSKAFHDVCWQNLHDAGFPDRVAWIKQWMGWPVGPHYAENSNVTQAHRLQGNLMLVVGELDKNVDPSSTLQVANALVKANKDFDLVLIPGQGHGAAETPYGSRRRADFFVRHLLNKQP
jgi:dipeptidyl-peptidase-4